MSAMLETIDGGVAVTVQDRGRPGYRKIGVPVSGALDPVYLAAANALLGNEPGAAALEVIISGPSSRFCGARSALLSLVRSAPKWTASAAGGSKSNRKPP